MNVYKILAFISLLATACGVSPQDASDNLEYSSEHPEEWCGWHPPQPEDATVEKAFNHPNGYGVTAAYGCFTGGWTGGFCYAPEHKVHRIRLFQDGQDAAWFKNLTDEYGAIRDRMNARGWQVSKWATGNPTPTMEAHTDSLSGPGVLAEVDYNGLTYWEFPNGDYITYAECIAVAHRPRIEANVDYQSASATQQQKWLKNMWDHELGGHCFGLPHTNSEDLLMSDVYYFPGPRFNSNLNPTAAELQMFVDFQPLD